MRKIIVFMMCIFFTANAFAQKNAIENITVSKGNVYYYVKDLQTPFKVLFLSDCHITLEDERGKDFYDYSKRMGGKNVEPENYGKSNGREKNLIASLECAKSEKAELVILGGDIINFPSLASVELIEKIMKESGLPWVYLAGNHDWHYEGEEGTSAQLRDKWIATNLKPLYQGNNPMYSSRIVNGVNFVTIDNSTFQISEEQLKFFKKQTKQKYPIILSMHIPLYLPGHNIDYGCGNPSWNAANDTYYKIERRNPWPEQGHTKTTYDFRELVLKSKNVIGIYAGHTHREMIDFHNGIPQVVTGSNFSGSDVLIHFVPSKK